MDMMGLAVALDVAVKESKRKQAIAMRQSISDASLSYLTATPEFSTAYDCIAKGLYMLEQLGLEGITVAVPHGTATVAGKPRERLAQKVVQED